MLEKTVEDHLVRRVAETGGQQRKVTWLGHKGAPDRLVGWPAYEPADSALDRERPARHVLVEMKKPKGPGAEAHQQREHKKLRAIGFEVRVIHTKEQVDEFILEMTS